MRNGKKLNVLSNREINLRFFSPFFKPHYLFPFQLQIQHVTISKLKDLKIATRRMDSADTLLSQLQNSSSPKLLKFALEMECFKKDLMGRVVSIVWNHLAGF